MNEQLQAHKRYADAKRNLSVFDNAVSIVCEFCDSWMGCCDDCHLNLVREDMKADVDAAWNYFARRGA